jgi:hypothetical protein
MERGIRTLAASLGITYEEAQEMLEESAFTNIGQLETGKQVIECIDPMTGTVEYMEVDDE